MKTRSLPFLLCGVVAIAGFVMFDKQPELRDSIASAYKKKKYTREEKAAFHKARWQYEYDLLKDPGTGRIPATVRQEEWKLAKTLPSKEYISGSGIQGADNLNNYIAAGPDSVGGRTRGLAYDVRFNGTTNRVILSGSVSGGIFRSVDAGANWIRVSPENDIHNLSSIVQDPRPGFQDIWYAGGGEPVGNSTSEDGAPYLSQGIWKSTNNGATWSRLPLQVTDVNGSTLGAGTLEVFDNPFDFVHKIIVNPTNGHIYVAAHRRLVRSTDGGASWNVVFAGVKPAGSSTGQMDIACSSTGLLYLGINGGFRDTELRGVWRSTTGNLNSWTRIAGGRTLGVDSVAGWRGNSYDIVSINPQPTPADTTFDSKRILVAIAPSNENIIYVAYENGLSQDGDDPQPEADLFHLNTTGGTNTWSNRSANMPDFEGQMDGVDPLELQDGYNFMIAIKPNDPNTVFIGGTNLFRSTNGFATSDATAWIGGYSQDFATGLKLYPGSHADMHHLVWIPNNNNQNPAFLRAMCANDGGLQVTDNIMATGAVNPVPWTYIRNYQTLQYFHIGISPEPNSNHFIGGSQDNGTQVRLDGDNNHIRIISGDGGAASIGRLTPTAFTLYGTSQLGSLYRYRHVNNGFQEITPTGLTASPGSGGFGDFVTYFKMNQDNPEQLYYVNFNRLFRTDSATAVSSSGWQELTGIRANVNPTNPTQGTNISIRTLEPSMGPYLPSHVLYIGTSNGKVFRLNDPRNAPLNSSAADITPPELEQLRTQGAPVNVNDIAVNPNNDEEIMVIVSNYSVTVNNTVRNDINIWWTNNAKASAPTWRKAEGNLTLPSIRSCMIVTKKEGNNSVTEYYVGTSVGLYSAVNIGSTLQQGGTVNWVREGGNVLNYAVITSLDYRPEDNVLAVGTHGNGLYYAQIGNPDFRPNQSTPVDEPVRNDENFITQAFPTFAVKNRIEYRTGNMFAIRRLFIRVTNLAGQAVISREAPYNNGMLDVTALSKGVYILTITSEDNRQQFIRKFIKD